MCYAINDYKEALSVTREHATGFERFPYLSNLSIISPFNGQVEYTNLKKQIENATNSINKEILNNFLSDSLLSEYISDTLVDWVIKNKPISSPIRDKKSVLNGYRKLIVDALISD